MVALSPVMRQFILHWGEMGTRWGINRTVAQIHALLYLSLQPLDAETIAQTLSVARSNVSTSLRDLQSWGIVRAVHLLGDRREHFEATKDVWEMFRVIVEGRKRREIDPTLEVLQACVAELDRNKPAESHTRQRLSEMLEFFMTVTTLYEEIAGLPTGTLRRVARWRGQMKRMLGAVKKP